MTALLSNRSAVARAFVLPIGRDAGGALLQADSLTFRQLLQRVQLEIGIGLKCAAVGVGCFLASAGLPEDIAELSPARYAVRVALDDDTGIAYRLLER